MSEKVIKFPASFQQQRIWFLENMDSGGTPSYNMPQLIKINKELSIEKLDFALKQLVDRHEILRTSFSLKNGELQQLVKKQVESKVYYIDCSIDTELFQQTLQQLVEESFSLSTGPLFKVVLIKNNHKEHHMFMNMHHIISDGWSIGVFMNELFRLYQGETLPELSIQYGDYADWQRKQVTNGKFDLQLDFWKGKLKGAPALLELPYDKTRPSVQSYKGETIKFSFSKETTRDIKRMSRETKATSYITLLAIFKVMIQKYSRSNDIVVGSPIAGRNIEEIENLIGFFANTVVTRTKFHDDMTYRQLVSTVREEVLSVYSNQDLPFEKIVEEIAPERNLSYNPLFQVMFTMQDASKLERAFGDIEIQYVPIVSSSSKFDLSLSAFEDESETLGFLFEYCSDIYEETTINRMINHFKTLCKGIINHPDQKLCELPIINEEELQCIERWNNTNWDFPQIKSLQSLIEVSAIRNQNKVAIKFRDRTLSYNELNKRCNRIAYYLRMDKGVKPNQLVGISVNRSIEAIIAKIAILKAGAAYVPIDPMYPIERKEHIVNDAELNMVIIDNERNKIDHFQGEHLDINEVEKVATTYPHNNLRSVNNSEDIAYVIYTSGSTGKPKGVLIQHQAVINHNLSIIEKFNLCPNERVLQFSSLSFDISVEEIFPTLISGATLVMRTENIINDYDNFLSWINREEISILNIPTAYWREWVNFLSQSDKKIHNNINLMVVGGERVSAAALKVWKGMYPDVRWMNAYGPTETTVTVTIFEAGAFVDNRNVPIGVPIGNMRAYIVDSNNYLLPPGVPGELLIGGVGLSKGYLNRPDLTEEKFIYPNFNQGERVYKTGDLALFRSDGNIEFLGRIDDQVKIRGYRIELGEVENVLEGLCNVKQAYVTVHQQDNKTRLIGYVVSIEEEGKIKERLADILPSYMIPSQIITLKYLPKNANGKVDKNLLPCPRTMSEIKSILPQGEIETKLAEIWSDVLDVPNVGVEDNFFELGGDSILSIQIISKAREKGVDLTAKMLFKHQTIREMSVHLECTDINEVDQGIVSGEFPLIPIQSWFFNYTRNEPSHYNQSVLLKLPPFISGGDIKQIVDKLISHHDGLRMIFPLGDYEVAKINSSVSADIVEEYYSHKELNSDDTFPQEVKDVIDRVQQSLNIFEGPMLKAVFLGFPNKKFLFIVIHHLVVDGVSWRVLLEDIDQLIGQINNREILHLPKKTTSFKEWAHRLKEYSIMQDVMGELSYWEDVVLTKEAIPKDYSSEDNTELSLRKLSFSLDKSSTNRLIRELPSVLDTKISEVLLAAFAHAYKIWSDRSRLVLDLEGHGREEIIDNIDLSRTVGWFTSIHPVSFDMNRISDSQLDNLKYVKNIHRSIPNNGIGFGLLKYLSGAIASEDDSNREICFNYLGQLDQINKAKYVSLHDGYKGKDRGKNNVRDYVIDVNVYVKSGQLNIIWDYSGNHYSDKSIESWGLLYLESIKSIICISGNMKTKVKTPADYELVQVNQKTIDTLNHSGNLKDLYPVTPMQEGMIRHSLRYKNSICHLQQFHVKVLHSVNIDAFRRAWESVVSRHDILRTSFGEIGGAWTQIVHEEVDLKFQYEDWVHLSSEERSKELEKLMIDDRKNAYSLDDPSLMRVFLYKINDKEYRLLWSFHQLLLDGWSLSIIFNEFLNVYQSLVEGTEITLDKQRSFKRYLKWLDELKKPTSDDLENLVPGSSSKSFTNEDLYAENSYEETSITITREIRSEIQHVLTTNKLTLNTLIQGLWAIVMKEDSKSEVVIGITTSGRPESLRYVNEITGLCINTLPLRVNFDGDVLLLSWLEEIQKNNLDIREDGYLCQQHMLGDSPFKSVVLFQNFPRKPESRLRFDLVEGFGVSPYPVSIVVNPGETMSIKLVYNKNLIKRAEARNLLNKLENLINEFATFSREELSMMLKVNQLKKSDFCYLE
ncbi:non-ribosomal peptide synthetase [Shouchella lonarensis]|uniref:non-ribosomal peptide synthetase n=1 Tax=Shouchella lonarensis TaxID=1464122 RepID=UPI000B84A801|nr:non-ribosomal peptide synthetase [Shouchella lonarensis]